MNNKEKGISKILQITKNLIKTQKKFLGYMFKDNNDMIKEQLPILLPNYKKNNQKELEEIKNCRRIMKNVSCENFFKTPKQISQFEKDRFKKYYLKKSKFQKKNYSFNQSSENIKGNYRLVNDILFDTYSNITERNYDEKKFYNEKDFIKRINKNISFIVNNLNNFKNNQIKAPPYSLTKLYKILHKGSDKEINIGLSSVSIKFHAQKDFSFKKEFLLPFFLIPIFYYNSEINIQKLLILLFKFNDNLKSFSFEYDEEFYNLIPKSFKKYDKKLNKRYHIYKFLWITYEKVFEVQVIMPIIELYIVKTKTYISKYIDEKLIMFLYSQDMFNWHFYLTNYLFSFKSFRKIIDTISSKGKINNQFFYTNKKIQLSENRIKENNLNDKKALFIFSNHENKNFLITLIPMSLEIPYTQNIKCLNKCLKFGFTIGEFISIIESSKFVEPLEYLTKFIEYNSITGEITFNYKTFNSVKKENLSLILKNQNNTIDNSLSTISDEDEFIQNKPFITKTLLNLQSIHNGELIEKDLLGNYSIHFDVKLNLLKKITFSRNLNEWGNIILLLLSKLKKGNNLSLFLRKTSNLKNNVRQNNTRKISITPTNVNSFKQRNHSSNQISFIKIKKISK